MVNVDRRALPGYDRGISKNHQYHCLCLLFSTKIAELNTRPLCIYVAWDIAIYH